MLATAHWRALGTSVHLFANDVDLAPARSTVERVLDEVDLAYSRFRPDSELQVVQASPRRPVRVGPLLGQAIEAALRVARQTAGAVDPTVGRALRAIGYDDDFPLVAGRGGSIAIRLEPVPGWRSVRYDRRTRELMLPASVELDLGSTGKALAADLAANLALDGSQTGGVLVSLGGDIATAGHAPAGGWRILAAESSETPPGSDGEVIEIEGGAVATSSTLVRRWRSGTGVDLHHLIDPWTGGPVDGPWRTATVVAANCVDANAASTAALVLGAMAIPWLASTGLPARLVDQSGGISRVGPWPAPAPGGGSDV